MKPPQVDAGSDADRPTASEASGTEQKIFDAALDVFARKGRDGARMQEIADHAGINRTLLHYYFRSKSHLYETVFAHGFRQFVSSLSQSLKSEPEFENSLRTFVHGYIDYLREHQSMARLMINECLCGGAILENHLTAAIAKRDGMPGLVMRDRIEAAIEAGEIRDVDPKHTMLTIVSACMFPFVALPTVRIFHPSCVEHFDEFLEQRKLHVVDLILRGLRLEAES